MSQSPWRMPLAAYISNGINHSHLLGQPPLDRLTSRCEDGGPYHATS